MSLVQVASYCCCSCVLLQLVPKPVHTTSSLQGGHHLLQLAPMLDSAVQLALVVFLPACEKVPDNHPLHTPIMTSPLDLEPGCCFMQELKRLSYDCLQTAHLVIHVHFIVISCTLPCISLTWVHHMHCLGTPARISRHLPTLYI